MLYIFLRSKYIFSIQGFPGFVRPSLYKITEIKRFNDSNGFVSQKICDRKLTLLRDDLATDLFDLEDDYYNSNYKWTVYHVLNWNNWSKKTCAYNINIWTENNLTESYFWMK